MLLSYVQMWVLAFLLFFSTLNSFFFFSKTKAYQLFQPNLAQLEGRSNVDVIKISTPTPSTRVSLHELVEKDVWVLHVWSRSKFTGVLFKWFSPVGVLLWYLGRDQVRGAQLLCFAAVMACGWQLSKLVDSFETALEDSKLIAGELYVESEQAAKRHFALTKKDAGAQTDSAYSRGIPVSQRIALPHYRATPPPVSSPGMYRAQALNDSPPTQPLDSEPISSATTWGVPSRQPSIFDSLKHVSRPVSSPSSSRASPAPQEQFAAYASPQAMISSGSYTPPRVSPPPTTQKWETDSMEVDLDFLPNHSAGYRQPAPVNARYVDVGLPRGMGHSAAQSHSSPPRAATNRFSAVSPISPPTTSMGMPPASPPGYSMQFDMPPTTSLNGFN